MKRILFASLTTLVALAACNKTGADDVDAPRNSDPEADVADNINKADLPEAPALSPTPAGLPELTIPADNILSAEKVHLGTQLFFDKRLSKDGTMACQTCHQHELGWTDGRDFAPKVGGAVNTRNAPTMYNVGYHVAFYWDGRAPTLEKNVAAAWKGNMGADPDGIAAKLAKIPGYDAQFTSVFGAAPSGENIVKALSAFVRTLRSGNSAWDKYEAGKKNAVLPKVVAGYKLFTGKAQCSLCHTPPLYFDTLYHNVGIGIGKDVGRGKVDAKLPGAFKTPGLRSVSKTAPYFHDSSAKTLEDAVKIMLMGGMKNPHLDPKLKPVALSDKQFKQLMAFLKALDSDEDFQAPTLP